MLLKLAWSTCMVSWSLSLYVQLPVVSERYCFLEVPKPLPPPLRRGEVLCGYQPTLVPQVMAGLGTSFPSDARQGSPVRRTGSTGRQQSQVNPSSSCWGTRMKSRPHICYIYAGDLGPALVCSTGFVMKPKFSLSLYPFSIYTYMYMYICMYTYMHKCMCIYIYGRESDIYIAVI